MLRNVSRKEHSEQGKKLVGLGNEIVISTII